ncbi:hypothetical protein ACFYXM_18705 [Streptomyces sp. NPDC002476]|uniref:hypothetical protein n=1 Tax=Streptomyces sp. NPDC002476 TaxID=3364648 RepID=UPI0036B2E3D8
MTPSFGTAATVPGEETTELPGVIGTPSPEAAGPVQPEIGVGQPDPVVRSGGTGGEGIGDLVRLASHHAYAQAATVGRCTVLARPAGHGTDGGADVRWAHQGEAYGEVPQESDDSSPPRATTAVPAGHGEDERRRDRDAAPSAARRGLPASVGRGAVGQAVTSHVGGPPP